VRGCTFNENYPWKDALFTIKTNSELHIYDSIFNKTYSVSRGSVILADYKNTYAKIVNSTFVDNFAFDGGVFFAH
jgi:hypothetical protein